MAGLFEFAIIFSAVDRATRTISNVADSTGRLTAAGKKLSNMGAEVTGFGGKIGLVGQQINGAIIGAATAISAPSLALEDALAKVQSLDPVSDSIAASIGRIRAEALGWQKDHTDGAAKFVDTTYMMLSAGLDEVAAVEATKNAMLVAKATMGDSTTAANLLATAYNTMGDKAAPVTEEMGRIADVVTKTQQAFQLADLNQLGEGLKNARAGAILAGLDFNQLSATIGLLNSSGLQGAEAGTAFKDALNRVDDASKKLGFSVQRTKDGQLDWIATMANLEGRVDELGGAKLPEVSARIREAFGDTGTQAIGMLLGKSDELAKGFEKVSDSAGVTANAAKAIEEAGSGPLTRLTNNLDLLKIQLADRLAPAAEALVPVVFQVVNAIGQWIDQNPDVIGLFADAIVELTASGSELAPVIGEVVASTTSWMRENPELVKGIVKVVVVAGALFAAIGPIIVALGLTMSAAGQVVSGFGALFGVAGKVVGVMGKLRQVVSAAPALIAKLLPAFGSAAAGAWSFAVALLANPITWIVLGMVAAAALLYVYWDPIVAFFSGIWTDIKAGFDQGFVHGILNTLKYFSPLYWIQRGMDAVTEYLFGFSLYDAGANILKTLIEGIESQAAAVVDKVQGVTQNVRDLLPFSPAKTGPLRDLHRVRIVETVAEGVRPDALVQAAAGTMAQVQQTFATPMSAAVTPVMSTMPVESQVMSTMPVEMAPEFSAPPEPAFSTMPISVGDVSANVTPVMSTMPVMPQLMNTMPVELAPQLGDMPAFSTMPITTAHTTPLVQPLPLVEPDTRSRGARNDDASAGGFGGNGGGITVNGGLHFHVGGSAEEDIEARLERWVRNNPGPIHAAVQREGSRQGRKGFSS